MTDREKAIVMAYTGIAMLTGDKLDLFYQYIEELLDRPVYTHELADDKVFDEIKEKSKPDFIRLCRETTADAQPIVHGHWIKQYTDGFYNGERNYKMICPHCDFSYLDNHCGMIVPEHFNYCPNCGAKMDEKKDSNGNWIYQSLDEVIDSAD